MARSALLNEKTLRVLFEQRARASAESSVYEWLVEVAAFLAAGDECEGTIAQRLGHLFQLGFEKCTPLTTVHELSLALNGVAAAGESEEDEFAVSYSFPDQSTLVVARPNTGPPVEIVRSTWPPDSP